MENKEIQILRNLEVSGRFNYRYDEGANAFISDAFESEQGNTYFNSLRLLKKLVVFEQLGKGYKHLFLNELKIVHCSTQKIMAAKTYHNRTYSQAVVRLEIANLVVQIFKNHNNIDIPKSKALSIVNESFNNNQSVMLKEMAMNQISA